MSSAPSATGKSPGQPRPLAISTPFRHVASPVDESTDHGLDRFDGGPVDRAKTTVTPGHTQRIGPLAEQEQDGPLSPLGWVERQVGRDALVGSGQWDQDAHRAWRPVEAIVRDHETSPDPSSLVPPDRIERHAPDVTEPRSWQRALASPPPR